MEKKEILFPINTIEKMDKQTEADYILSIGLQQPSSQYGPATLYTTSPIATTYRKQN
jgi:hypothetical protein